MGTFHALRYRPEVPLNRRKHGPTLGRFESWIDAEDARVERFNAELLEVVVREDRD